MFRQDIVKILHRLDQIDLQREKEFNQRLLNGKPFIQYSIDDMKQVKCLISLLFLSKIPLKTLLHLKSDDYSIHKDKLVILKGLNVTINRNKDDELFVAIKTHLEKILPNEFVFPELKDNPSLYYYINKWLQCLDKKVNVKNLYI